MSKNDEKNEENEENEEKTRAFVSDTLIVRLDKAEQAAPCIVVLVGPTQSIGKQWAIEESSVVIGRSVDSDIFLQDLSVSKLHAKMTLKNGVVSITDLKSTNKTIVNDKELEVNKEIELFDNDRVKLGNVIFKFLEKGNIESVAASETYDRLLKDNLTGIYNKATFSNKAQEFFKKAKLLGLNLGLITFDLDHFKEINDIYGHSTGDDILKKTAGCISEGIIREKDIFARTGGEEFCILLLGSNAEQSKEVAERVRATIESIRHEFENQSVRISVSVGVSVNLEEDESWLSIFKRADKALYEAKRSGRNQVCFTISN